MMKNKFERLPAAVAAGLAVLVVAACAIRLRGDESASSESLATDQVAAAKLEQCRSITYEQKEALLECQRIWAEQRNRFLGRSKFLGSKSTAGTSPSSSAIPRKDESRLPSGSPSIPSQSE